MYNFAGVVVGMALVTAFAQDTDAGIWGKAPRTLLATRSGQHQVLVKGL